MKRERRTRVDVARCEQLNASFGNLHAHAHKAMSEIDDLRESEDEIDMDRLEEIDTYIQELDTYHREKLDG